MTFSRSFELGLLLRLALILGIAALAIAAFQRHGVFATRILLVLIALALLAEFWFYVRRTNVAIARFVDAVRFEDFSQRFALGKGAGFDALGSALDAALIELGRKRAEAAADTRFLGAVVDDAPAALLTIDYEERVTLLNKAARRQFVVHNGIRLADFLVYGAEFQSALALTTPGRRVTRMMQDGVAHRMLIETARLERLGQDFRIVSVLPVQNVLGAVELATQSDLVRVLTHEIMNSLTPVSSLVRSAADMLADTKADQAEVRTAVETAARRAEGMQRFVESYRAFARPPNVRRQSFAAGPWIDEVARLFAASPAADRVALTVDCSNGLKLDADPDLVAQVCLNLLRNAATAARGFADAPAIKITLSALSGGRVGIEVADNGPGIDADRREDIFLPFYTTRSDGNGVGLSFARQIVLAHGGSIDVDTASGRGACFRIVL